MAVSTLTGNGANLVGADSLDTRRPSMSAQKVGALVGSYEGPTASEHGGPLSAPGSAVCRPRTPRAPWTTAARATHLTGNAFQQSTRPLAAPVGRRIGPSVRQREGPEERGSDPPISGFSRPRALRLCGGPWGSLPLSSGQEVAGWRAAIGSRRRRAIDHDRDHDGGAQRSGLRTGCLGCKISTGNYGSCPSRI